MSVMLRLDRSLLVFLAACFLLVLVGFVLSGKESPHIPPAEKVKGVCWVAGDSVIIDNFADLNRIGANWISQTPFGWQQHHNSPSIRLETQHVLWGETDSGIRETTLLARKAGLKTMLKPHIWLTQANGKWRSDIVMDNEEDWQSWFTSYEAFILHYAKLAEQLQIDALCIGTELHLTATIRPDAWKKIISEVRKVYSGDLTYAANFYKEYEDITFWDDLDYIGVQGYFPLTNKMKPEVTDLESGWRDHKRVMRNLSKKYNKEIYFTELGYRNSEDAAVDPWTWPGQMSADRRVVCDSTQDKCYQAFFQSLWDESWFGGVFIWKWFHQTYRYNDPDFIAEKEERRERRKQRNPDWNVLIDFSPQGKPAEQTIQKFFSVAE